MNQAALRTDVGTTRSSGFDAPSDRLAEARLHEVLALHFDDRHGAPFWLDRARELGFDPRREIRSISDLPKLGTFRRTWQYERPVRDFVPRTLWRDLATELVFAETGGTSGAPVRTVFSPGEFVDAFGTPFVAISERVGFPRGGTWLFVGPSGPHVIGQAARLLARMHDSHEPFGVDLDPRHARSQTPGSIGERLYVEHVIGQSLDLLGREPIDVLFTTPPLLAALGDALEPRRRDAIRGIHLGGMPVSASQLELARNSFENAVVLPAYGNSLFGILPMVDTRAGSPHVDYSPLAGRVLIDVVENRPEDGRVPLRVAVGETGRVMFTRIDRTTFLPNVLERDVATRVATPLELTEHGFARFGLRDPRPLAAISTTQGLY